MSKVISFRIRLEGSKDVLSQIDKIGKRLQDALNTSGAKIDGKAVDAINKGTKELSKGLDTAGKSISEMQKRLSQLRSEGKANTLEYGNLVNQVASLRAQQVTTNQEITRNQKKVEASINLQKLLDGEIKSSDLTQRQFFQALNSGLDKADPRYKELTKEFSKLRNEEKLFRQGLKEQERAFEATKFAAGSYRALNAELGKLRASYKELAEAERNGVAGKQTLARIKQLDKELKGLDKSLGNYQRNVGNYASALRKIGTALGTLGVTTGVSSIISGASRLTEETVKLFDTQEKANVQLQTVLESTGEVAGRTFEQLREQAQRLQGTTLFGDEQTQQLQALTLTFTNIREDVFDRTIVAAQDMATALANASGGTADLKGAGIQLGKALNDPIGGLSSLSRAGVQFSDSQEKLIKSLVETGEIAQAQNIILAELETQFGGSAEAAARAGAGGITQLENKIGDVKEAIGGQLLPVQEALTRAQLAFFTNLSKGIELLLRFVNILRSIPGFIKENQAEIAALAAALVALNAQSIAAAANALRQAAAQKAALIATKAQAVAQRVLNAVLKANPIGLIITALAGLAAIFARVYKSSQTLRSGIAGTFSALKNIVGNVVGGLVKQLTGFGNILKGVFTLDLETIKQGAKEYAQGVGDVFLRSGQGAGEAFVKGFEEKTLADLGSAVDNAISSQDSQLADKVNEQIVTALEKGQITNAQADAFQDKLIKGLEPKGEVSLDGLGIGNVSGFEGAGTDAGKSFNDGFSKEIEKLEKERTKAAENIRKLETTLITDEVTQERTKATSKAESDISSLVGDDEQIRKQTTLIKSQLAISLAEIEASRSEGFATSIESAKQKASEDIAALTGNSEEITAKASVIKTALAKNIAEISASRTEAISNAIAELESSKQKEIEALTGSEEEIQANTAIINQAYTQATSQLTETRKAAIVEQESEVLKLRKEIISQFGGEVSDTLKNASVEELAITKQIVEARIKAIEEELDAKRKSITQLAELEKQRLQIELQGASPKRAKEIADQIRDIDRKLKLDLLNAEEKSSKEKLKVIQGLVPESLKASQDLADKELAINAEKNKQILEQEEETEKQRQAIRQALQDAAFTVAEAFIESRIEAEKQRTEEAFEQEKEQSNERAVSETARLEEDYKKRIELAGGNSQEQARLEEELASKKVEIESRRAKREEAISKREAQKRKSIARKEALINAAVAVTRTLANIPLPAAIPALIALAATTAAQLIQIESTKFAKGASLSSFVEGMSVRLHEAGKAYSSRPGVSSSEVSLISRDITRFAQGASMSLTEASNASSVNTDASKASDSYKGATTEKRGLLSRITKRLFSRGDSLSEKESKSVSSLRNSDKTSSAQSIAYRLSEVGSALASTKQSASEGLQSSGYSEAVSRWDYIAAQTKDSAKDEQSGYAYELRQGSSNYVVDQFGQITRKDSLTDISKQSSAQLPSEGLIKGAAHDKGGVKATYKGKLIELEGGEYLLRNGHETYIINKQSASKFRTELNEMKGNTSTYDPTKRMKASMINAFQGFGVKFQSGAALLRGSNPIEAPQGLQNIRQQVTREELQNSILSISSQLSSQVKAIETKTDTVVSEIRNETNAINGRFDRIVVVNNPEEVVAVGNEQLQARNNAEL